MYTSFWVESLAGFVISNSSLLTVNVRLIEVSEITPDSPLSFNMVLFFDVSPALGVILIVPDPPLLIINSPFVFKPDNTNVPLASSWFI